MGALSAVLVIGVLVAELCFAAEEKFNGSTVLEEVPLIVGSNYVAYNIRELETNQVGSLKFDTDLKEDSRWKKCSRCHTDLPKLQEGKVGVQFWVTSTDCNSQYKDAVEQTVEQIDVIKRLTDKYPDSFMFVDSAAGLEQADNASKIASLIGIGGGHSIDSRLGLLRTYYRQGARYLSFADSCNTPWAGIEEAEGGLSAVGQHMVIEMNRIGMLIYLSDVSIKTIDDTISMSLAPVAVTSSIRNPIKDEFLPYIADKNGIVMVNLEVKDEESGMSDVIDHINYIKQRAGVDHIGIGGGFDAPYKFPEELKDVSHFPNLFDALTSEEPVWSVEDLKKLANLNLVRVLKEVEAVREMLKKQKALEKPLPKKYINKDARECRSDLGTKSGNDSWHWG